MINREDMLELTRRMTPIRNHFVRVAGAYIDEEGYIDGTFNTHFQKLKGAERDNCIEIAKAIPFSETNRELRDYPIPGLTPGSIWQMLYALRDCELKNDAMLLTFYELVTEKLPKGEPYAIYVYYASYDVPVKGTDHMSQWESDEVYQYLIIAICPTDEEYHACKPYTGFMYPAFTDRAPDLEKVYFYQGQGYADQGMKHVLGL